MVHIAMDEDTKSVRSKCGSSKKKTAPIPDGGWGWVVAFASLVASMISDGLIYSYGVLTPEFVKYYGISRSTVGWMGSLLVAVSMLIGPFVSYLCARYSYRSVALVGSVISAVGFAVPYFYNELWFLILTSSVICGVGFGMVYLPSIMIVYSWFEKKRTIAIGIAVSGSGLGTFVFSPLLEFLLTRYEWKLTMLITGCIFLLMIPCCLTYTVPQLKKEENEEAEETEETEAIEMEEVIVVEKVETEEKEDKDVEQCENESVVDAFKRKMSNLELLKNPIFLLFMISSFMNNIGFNAPYMFAKDRAIQAGISEVKGSFLISSIGIGNCIGRICFGLISQLKFINRFHLFNGALVLTGSILILSWVVQNYILMVIYTFVFGLSSGAFITLTSVILSDIFGMANLDRAFGFTLCFHGASVLVGPPFAGWIYDVSLSFNLAFAVCGIFIAVSGVIMYLAYISKNFRKVVFHN